MKDLTLQIDIKIYDYNELSDADRQLMDAAREATQRSYAPYSHFSVGAAARLDFLDDPIPPCGACRQVMLETEKRFKQPMRILLFGKKGIYEMKSVGALLPLSFDASSME